MIKKVLSTLGTYQEKHPLTILLVMLTITLFFLSHAINLQTDASFDTMYPEDSNYNVLKQLVATEYGATDLMFVLFQIDESVKSDQRVNDIRDPRVLEAMRDLTRTLEEEPDVAQVFSIVNAIPNLPQTFSESKIIFDNLGENRQGLVSDDYNIANMIISVNIPSGAIERIEAGFEKIVSEAEKPVGVQMILTGQPSLINRIMNLLINDNLVTILIAIVFVFFFLWYFFRSATISLTAIIPVIVTLIWLAGTLVLLDIRITMMTAAVGAMMVGMSIDYSIHITHSFHDLVRKGKKSAAKKTVRQVGGALFVSALTTIGGFIAMLFGVSPSSQIQGTVLALGIAFAFLSTITILPCLLILQGEHMYKPLDKIIFRISGDKERKPDFKQKILRTIAKFQVNNAKKVIIAVLIASVFIVPGAALLRFDTDNANWIPEKDPVIESFDVITNAFGGTETMNLLILQDHETTLASPDLRDVETLRYIKRLDSSLEELTYIDIVDSPADHLTEIPKSRHEINLLIRENEQLRSYFSKDYSVLRVALRTDSFGDPATSERNNNYFEIINEVNTLQPPEGVIIKPQGGIADFIELEANLGADVGRTAGIGFLFVIAIATFMYGSLTAGFLAFIPIIFAMLWTVGVMGWIGLPFTVLTSGLLSIVMGMGIDFSIHLIHGVKSLTSKGVDITKAITETVVSTGEAILAATLTTIIGFTSLALASLLVTQRLGYTLAIAIAMSFFACMLIVPAILFIEHNIKNKVRLSK